MIAFVRPNIPHAPRPNAETRRAIRDIEENKNLQRFKNVDDFWAEMGIDPNA